MDISQSDNNFQSFKAIGEGDELAFRRIFHAYNARLYPFALKITKSEPAAQDIIQEAFLRLWVHREDVAQMEYPVAWLYKIVSNLALTYLRKKAAELKRLEQVASLSVPVNVNDTADNINFNELQSLLNEAIEQLPPRRKLIYTLSRQQGMSHKEIASQLGISQHTIKNQMVTALKFIQKYIRQALDLSIPVIIIFFFL